MHQEKERRWQQARHKYDSTVELSFCPDIFSQQLFFSSLKQSKIKRAAPQFD